MNAALLRLLAIYFMIDLKVCTYVYKPAAVILERLPIS